MTTIRFERGKSGHLSGFTAQGHAEAGESGNDIVCATVSAITQTAVLGLVKVAGITPRLDRRNGYLSVQLDWVDATKTEVKTILDTAFTGLTDIAHQYPKNLTIIEGE